MNITIIAAMTHEGVIGHNNTLPWNIPDEMKHFKTTTTGATVIMGLKTFQSIGKPLPNRNNIILGPPDLIILEASVCSSIEEALVLAQTFKKEIFIIGGAHTYAQFLPHAKRMIISYIKYPYHGNIYFPKWNESDWKIIHQKDYQDFLVVTYEKASTGT